MRNNTTPTNTSQLFEDILFKLSARKSGARWIAKCPAHDDQRASLSLKQDDDGTILMKCFAGCEVKQILDKLNLPMSALFSLRKAVEKKEISATYDYKDENGKLLYQTVRFEPKTFRQRQPDGNGGFEYNLKGVRRVVYRLPELMKADPQSTVFICEGEKDVDALIADGLVATTNAMGAGKWRDDYSQSLIGRDVVILPDNDDPGRAHGQAVAKSLQGLASSIKILNLPNLPEKGDVSDWLKAGGDAEALCVLAKNAPEWSAGEPTDQQKQAAKSRKIDVIELAIEKAKFFHDEDNKHYASVTVGSHLETYSVESKAFKIWLAGLYFEATGSSLHGDALKESIATIQALAQYRGEERSVSLRLASHDGKIYFDLCNREWQIVEISSDDWRIISSSESPVRFVRRASMLSLPSPIKSGSVTELRGFLNVEDETTWALIVAWLVMTFHPNGPYPILSVCGEQGSAKTTACKMLRSLIDPNKADLRAVPREERDLMIAASNSHLLAYDNLSGISKELSDSLCRVATGAGFGTRTLHTDSEETIFSVKRPILTNGIIDTNEYPDLLDRGVSVFLRSIPDDKRREERELWPAFNEAKPRILGAILSAVSHAIKHHADVKLDRMPRMADFATWAVAAEPALQLSEGAFLEAYTGNRDAAHEMALDSSPAIEVKRFIENLTEPSWTGSASELLKALNQMLSNSGEDPKDKRGWPAAAHILTGKLRRIAPNLRAHGIDVNCGRTNAGSIITIDFSQKNLENKRHKRHQSG